MKQSYDNFDIENIGLSLEQYKIMAMKTPIVQTTMLLETDWKRRAFHQNIIASANGITGSGKSSFISTCALKIGKIYKETHNYKYEPFRVGNVYYEPEEMQARIPSLKEGELLVRDEHLHGQAGMMSDLTTNVLTDAEQQLRKNKNSFLFASIEEEDHAHFFVFEMKHIVPDQNGYPRFTVAMLKTPLYTDPRQFVWRGLVAMPFPNKEYWTAYEKRKDEHIAKLKSQYGNTLTPVGIDAIKIYNKRHEDLICQTREGLVKPINIELMKSIVSDEIGTRKFTNAGYSVLYAKIREAIIKEFAKQNADKMLEIENRRNQAQLEKKEILQMQIDEARRIKEVKMEAFKLKLDEDKRRNDLKQKALEIRELELERAREVKEQKAKIKAIETEEKINHFKEDSE
jgi:hypothetical protein